MSTSYLFNWPIDGRASLQGSRGLGSNPNSSDYMTSSQHGHLYVILHLWGHSLESYSVPDSATPWQPHKSLFPWRKHETLRHG